MSKKRNRTAFFYVLPCLIVLGLFCILSSVMNVDIQFSSPLLCRRLQRSLWGFANFRKLFSDPIILTCLKNNILYAVISVIIQVGLWPGFWPLCWRTGCFRRSHHSFGTTYFIPTLLSMTVVCLLFEFIYNPQMGLLNSFLELIGLDKSHPIYGWGKSSVAMYAVIAVSQCRAQAMSPCCLSWPFRRSPGISMRRRRMDGAGKGAAVFEHHGSAGIADVLCDHGDHSGGRVYRI